jgi:hypothetical protein
MQAGLSQNDFEVLARRAGLPLSAAELAEMYQAWTHVEPMLARIRGQARGREAEPAVIFRPEPLP